MSYIDASFVSPQDTSANCTDTSSNVCSDISCSIYPYGSDASCIAIYPPTGWEDQPSTNIMDLSGCDISIDLSGMEYNIHTSAYKFGNGIMVETEITSLDSCGQKIVDIPISTFVTDEIPESTSLSPIIIPSFILDDFYNMEHDFMEFTQAIQYASSNLRQKIIKVLVLKKPTVIG